MNPARYLGSLAALTVASLLVIVPIASAQDASPDAASPAGSCRRRQAT